MPTGPMEGFLSLKFRVWKYPIDSGVHPTPHSHTQHTLELLSYLVTVL